MRAVLGLAPCQVNAAAAATGGDVSDSIQVQCSFVQLVPVYEVRRDSIYGGGYAITRDYRGKEISRTQTEWFSKLTWTAPPEGT